MTVKIFTAIVAMAASAWLAFEATQWVLHALFQ
jgi:hypothetical protein